MTITSTTTSSTRNRLTIAAGLAVGAILLAGGLAACGSADSDRTSDSTAPKQEAAVDSAAITDVDDTSPLSDIAADSPAPQPAANGGSGEAPSGDAPVAPPTIDAFVTPESIDCHNGNFQEFTASWETTNAVKVTISIDGPGIYAEYPADGETSLPFNCNSAHSFLLTAYGSDGTTATRTVTLEPRNVQMRAAGSDEEPQGAATPMGTTAKMEGGATGDGPATDDLCNAVAGQLDALHDLGASTTDFDDAITYAEAAGALQQSAEGMGCFFVSTGGEV
jgi:hypothetical protein